MWFLVGGDADTMPYFAVVNRQGRYTVAGETLQSGSDDPLSGELADLGVEGLSDRVTAIAAG
jgi:hypothetical protein